MSVESTPTCNENYRNMVKETTQHVVFFTKKHDFTDFLPEKSRNSNASNSQVETVFQNSEFLVFTSNS